MTYEEFKAKYESLTQSLLSYSPRQAGALVFSEKLAALVDEYPEFEEKYDLELG